MGFFDAKADCVICDKQVGLNRLKTTHGWICRTCMTTLTKNRANIRQNSIEELKSIAGYQINVDSELVEIFEPNQYASILQVDSKNKLFEIKGNLYRYSDLVDFELLEDNNSIVKGGLGRAIVGNALFGGVGAVVGGVTGKRTSKKQVTKLVLKVTVNDMHMPCLMVNFIDKATKSSSKEYQIKFNEAHKVVSLLQVIASEKDSVNDTTESVLTNVEELRQYKQLLDENIITQEEFEQKKKELLKI